MKNITISFKDRKKLMEARKLASAASKLGAGLALGENPPLNILKTSYGALVKAEVPGVDPSLVSIKAKKNTIEISGHHKRPAFKTSGYYIQEESTVGDLYRLVELPFEFNSKNMEVNFWNGILTIKVSRMF